MARAARSTWAHKTRRNVSVAKLIWVASHYSFRQIDSFEMPTWSAMNERHTLQIFHEFHAKFSSCDSAWPVTLSIALFFSLALKHSSTFSIIQSVKNGSQTWFRWWRFCWQNGWSPCADFMFWIRLFAWALFAIQIFMILALICLSNHDWCASTTSILCLQSFSWIEAKFVWLYGCFRSGFAIGTQRAYTRRKQ